MANPIRNAVFSRVPRPTPKVAATETAKGTLATLSAQSEPVGRAKACLDSLIPEPATCPLLPEQQQLQQRSEPLRQSSRTALHEEAQPEACSLPLARPSRFYEASLHAEAERLQRRYRQSLATTEVNRGIPRLSTCRGIRRKYLQRPLNNLLTTLSLLAAALRGESPDTIAPCGKFVMGLYRLRSRGRG